MYETYTSSSAVTQIATRFMYKVFGWMTLALSLTGVTAYFVGSSPEMVHALYSNPGMLIGIVVGQLALVLLLGFMLPKMNFATALFGFLLYSFLTGLLLSSIFIIYTMGSIGITLGVAAAMFGVMALYGYMTKADLSSLGSIMLMALIGLIIGGFVNWFVQSPMINYVLSGIGVIVFSLLTAYDVQKIKNIGSSMLLQDEDASKIAIFLALTLYLDFINLFLYLLQFFGEKKSR